MLRRPGPTRTPQAGVTGREVCGIPYLAEVQGGQGRLGRSMRLGVVLCPQLGFLRAQRRLERVVPLVLGRGFVRQQLGESSITWAQFQLIE